MKKLTQNLIFLFLISFLINGCGVGSLVAVPFKVTGAIVNIVTPEVVGDTISGTGDVLEDTIPF